MYWRITLDEPHTYATEQGAIKGRFCKDFRDSANGLSDTWRCPVTGLVMLNPSFRNRSFGNDFQDLANFRHNQATATFWRNIARSPDALALVTAIKPAGQTRFFDALTLPAAIATINASDGFYDNLQWALESLFTLNIDEAFAIHYRGLTDELLRKNNWMYLQWDDIGIHVSHQGRVRVYWYEDRGSMEDAPTLVHEFDIADPGDLLGKSGSFVFLPIPRFGLAMYHLMSQPSPSSVSSNTSAYALKGSHLIPWGERVIGSHARLFEVSEIRIGLNPFHANAIGFQNIRFPASGTYLEEIFDPGYRPSLSPDAVGSLSLDHFGSQFGTIGTTLRNNDNSGNWAAGTDRQGRIRFDVATSDDRYTPFVYEWDVQWLPVFATRDTEPVEISGPSAGEFSDDVLMRLEMTDDSFGKFEGTAKLKLQTPEAIAIAERGDTTFKVEYSEDTIEWTVYNGGIGKFDRDKLNMMYHPAWGFYWEATMLLHGQEERFEELHTKMGTGFDNLTVAEGINLCLSCSGFSTIAEDDLPGPATNRRIPALKAEDNFRFVPRDGDRISKVIDDLLLMVRAQWVEVKLKYDWEAGEWTLVQRERNTDEGWLFTYDETLEDHPNRIAYYAEPLHLQPNPPEANVFSVIGVADTGRDTKQIESTPIRNVDAISNAEIDNIPNVDYAGRVKTARALAIGLTDQYELNRMGRVIAPRVLHRNMQGVVQMPAGHHSLDITPDTYIILRLPPMRGELDERDFSLWVKQRTLIVEGDDHGAAAGIANERMILNLDETWENPFRGSD